MPTDHVVVTVDRVDPARYFAKAVDGAGVDYFIYGSALATTGRWGFADLRIGSRVRGIAIDHPKGARLIEVDVIEL